MCRNFKKSFLKKMLNTQICLIYIQIFVVFEMYYVKSFLEKNIFVQVMMYYKIWQFK